MALSARKMRLRDRLIRGTALNLIAMSFNQGSTLIASILVARILKKEAFGEYAMVYTTLLTAVTLSQLAMGYTSSKYVAEFRIADPVRTGRILGSCAIVSNVMAAAGSIVLILFSPWLATVILKAPNLSLPLVIGSGFLFFSAINGYQSGVLLGLEAFGGLAKAGVISGAISVAAIFLGARQGGLIGAVWGLSIGAFIRFVIHHAWLRLETHRQGIRLRLKGSLSQERGIIGKFAMPAALAGYFTMPMIWLANSFLVRQPGGFGEMALFSAANNLRILVLFLPNVINNVTLSILNNEKGEGDSARYHRVFRFNVLSISLATLSCAALMGLLGRPVLLLFGREFGEGRVLLWILLATAVFEGLNTSLYQYIQSQAAIWKSFFAISLPRDITLALSAYLLVPRYAGIGLAAAFLGSSILSAALHLSLVARLHRKERLRLYACEIG